MSKYSQELTAEIIANMRRGAGVEQAAGMSGVTRQTVWNWRQQGRRDGLGPKFEFDREVTRIEHGLVAGAENTVKSVMIDKKHPKRLNAAIWYLEKTRPEQYGKRDAMTEQFKQQMAIEFLDFLHERVDANTYNIILAALDSGSGDESETDPLQLPE